jgi:hypothetical protein
MVKSRNVSAIVAITRRVGGSEKKTAKRLWYDGNKTFLSAQWAWEA